MKWRHVVYAVSVVGLAAAVLADHRTPEDAVVEPAARSAVKRPEPVLRGADDDAHPGRAPQTDTILALIPRARLGGIADAKLAGTAFSARSWAPPPAASSATAEAPTPQPLPFSYIGKQLVGDTWQVFIAEKDDVRMVQVADLIDEQYQVLTIDAQTMTLDYLPLHAKLSMSLE